MPQAQPYPASAAAPCSPPALTPPLPRPSLDRPPRRQAFSGRHPDRWRPSRRAWLVPALGALLLLPACSPADRAAAPRPSGGILVLSSVGPLTLITQAIATGCGQVEPLVAGSGDGHDLHASPADLARLRRARVLVINGFGLEHGLEPMLRAAANPQLRLITSSDGVIPARHNGLADPHLWLDPRRVRDQARTIRAGLVAADPDCAGRYRTNAQALDQRLGALDRELARQLAPWRGAILGTPHAFATTFADRYGLRTEAAVRTPEERPTPEDLRRVMARLRGPGPRALLVEPGQEGGALAGVARDLGLRPTSFDPMETGLVPAAGPAPEEPWASTLRRNTTNLVAAFRASSR